MARNARAQARKQAALEAPAGPSGGLVAGSRGGVEAPSVPETLDEWGARLLAMRAELAREEAALVAALRAQRVSWERIGWVLQRPSETVRRRYGPPSGARTPSPGLDEPLPLDL